MDSMIATKQQMTRLLQSGRLGNTMKTFLDPEELIQDRSITRWGVRNRTQSSSPIRVYDNPIEDIWQWMTQFEEHGFNLCRDLYWYEAPPDDSRTIQGELQRTEKGLMFRYTFSKKPMRNAFYDDDQCGHAQGLAAVMMLDQYAGREVRLELEEIIDHWPGHVLEFTGYSKPVGIYGKRYIVWEVRNY